MVCMKTDVHSEKDANETKSKCVRLISNFLAGLKPFLIFLHQTSPCPGDLGDDFSTLSSNLVGILRFLSDLRVTLKTHVRHMDSRLLQRPAWRQSTNMDADGILGIHRKNR